MIRPEAWVLALPEWPGLGPPASGSGRRVLALGAKYSAAKGSQASLAREKEERSSQGQSLTGVTRIKQLSSPEADGEAAHFTERNTESWGS